jgi:hypothetical protein
MIRSPTPLAISAGRLTPQSAVTELSYLQYRKGI